MISKMTNSHSKKWYSRIHSKAFILSLGFGILIFGTIVSFFLVNAQLKAEDKDKNRVGTAPNNASKESFSANEILFYEKEVLPILKANCYKCHGDGKNKGNFSLSSRESTIEGGDLGKAVVPFQPESSNLIKAIQYKDGLEMPPKGKLSEKEIQILIRWVKDGLPMTANKNQQGKTEIVKKTKGGVVTPESKNYWAYRKLSAGTIPQVKDTAWIKNPIDAFILSKLEAKNLTPAKPLDRVRLIRRVYYDLIGLPPTPEEVTAFTQDQSPNAYEKVIDHLLSLPQYGEKWGRHWLDLVHFAETNGYERDSAKPFAYRYRDYVIESFNNDKPYDQFIREQIAGDDLPERSAESIIATGYYRMGIWDDEAADRLQARFDELDDILATTSQVFLATTMNCARCHEHKIDPIPHADYYRLLAFFVDIPRHDNNANHMNRNSSYEDITAVAQKKIADSRLLERDKLLQKINDQLVKLENQIIVKLPAEDQRAAEGPERTKVVKKLVNWMDEKEKQRYQELKNQLRDVKKRPVEQRELALCVANCNRDPEQTYIMLRGNPHAHGKPVTPGFPQVLGFPDPAIPKSGPNSHSSGRRLVLANWIATKENPLTARVLVNRLWQFHFGRGICPTSNDFGKFGEAPTHPELLDWLAQEFLKGDWHIKRMHKLMMLSNTYQMSSQANEKALQIDPANQLFWRFNMRRLTAEEVRDSLLWVSGSLNLKMGGPSIYPRIPQEVLATQSVPGSGWHTSNNEEANRRSVYVHIKRSLLVPILSQHDQADTDTSCPVRYTTTVPTQSLGMLNGEFSNEQAVLFAQRLQKKSPRLNDQIAFAINLVTNRPATQQEIEKDLKFIQELKQKQKLSDFAVLKTYCLMLLNTNEFIYLD